MRNVGIGLTELDSVAAEIDSAGCVFVSAGADAESACDRVDVARADFDFVADENKSVPAETDLVMAFVVSADDIG